MPQSPLSGATRFARRVLRSPTAAPAAAPVDDPVDELTGMLLPTALPARLHALAELGGAVAVLELDIVGPDYNAHALDDVVRSAIGRAVISGLRPADACLGLEGNEVCLILPGLLHAGDAARVAERVRATAGSVHVPEAPEYVVRASLGMAIVRAGDDAALGLERARAALRDTRVMGLDQFVIDTRSQTKRAAYVPRLRGSVRPNS